MGRLALCLLGFTLLIAAVNAKALEKVFLQRLLAAIDGDAEKRKADCGFACENGGELNKEACRCFCRPGFSGIICEQRILPARDESNKLVCLAIPIFPDCVNCSTATDDPKCGQEYGYGKRGCDLFYNVQGDCPIMCGLCDDKK